MKKRFLKRTSLFLALLFATVSVFGVSARAAAPVITVQNTTSISGGLDLTGDLYNVSDMKVTAIVSNLRIANLEAPKAGQKLDTRATVLSDGGYYWEIPVIWVDETGTVSYICLPGKNYRPVLAYFIPKNVVVANDLGSNTYTIKLPGFLEGIIDNSNLLMFGSQSYGITFITTGDLASMLVESADGALTGRPGLASSLVKNSDIEKFFNTSSYKTLKNFVDYVPPVANDTETAQTNDNSGSSTNSGTSTNGGKSEESGGSGGSGGSEEKEEKLTPTHSADYTGEGSDDFDLDKIEPVDANLVSVYCTQNTIDEIGEENLQKLLALIIDVIEPQAVYQLNSGFAAYTSGIKEKLLGKEIGLSVYNSKVDDVEDGLANAVAYVEAQYLDDDNTEFGYYIGIDVMRLYQKNSDDEYELDESQLTDLCNTVVHELMHAYMYDYTRTGMVGMVSTESETNPKDNEFPEWFVEGIASCVENVYSYRPAIFDAMGVEDAAAGEKYTEESLYEFYTTYSNDKYGNPSIDSVNKYYANNVNTASAYVSGYLAVMYLGAMANDYFSSSNKEELVVVNDDGSYYYNSDAIRVGLSYILEYLNDGFPLDTIIDTISGDKYDSTQDFQDKFLTKSGDEYDESYDFCLGVLNYLDWASAELSKDSTDAVTNDGDSDEDDDEEVRANGSVLLPFDTAKTSVIESEVPAEIGEQLVYLITPGEEGKDPYVISSVDNTEAIESAGVKESAYTESEETDLTEEQKLAAKDAEQTKESMDSTELEASENKDDAEATDTAENEGTKETSAVDDKNATNGTALQNDKDVTEETTSHEGKDATGEIPEESKPESSEEVSSDTAEKAPVSDEASDADKEVVLLPNLVEAIESNQQKIEDPGTQNTEIEKLSEAVAAPAQSETDNNSESDDDDDDGNSDGDGDSDGASGASDGEAVDAATEEMYNELEIALDNIFK